MKLNYTPEAISDIQEIRRYMAWCKILCKRNSTKSRMALRKQCKLGAEALLTRGPGGRAVCAPQAA